MLLRLLWALLLVFVFGVTAQQDEERVYFSLMSSRTVFPGEPAPVQVQVHGVRQLEFRLYRVDDPEAFFQKLGSPSQFPDAARRPVHARTPLENFSAWKRKWRSRVRDVIRMQFSPESRSVIRARLHPEFEGPPRKSLPGQNGVEFASLPLLNPQQLVKKWTEALPAVDRWTPITVQAPLPEKGVYVLEATDQRRQAYTLLMASEMALITKAAPGKLIVRAVDRRTGGALPGCALALTDRASKGKPGQATAGADGLAMLELHSEAEEGVLLTARCGQDFAASPVSSYQITAWKRETAGYIYTDRPIYRPGHAVNYKVILRQVREGSYVLPEERRTRVTITDAEGKAIVKKDLLLTKYGTASGLLDLPADAPLGYYGIQAGWGDDEERIGAYGGFRVEEYRKPEYEVRVSVETRRVLQGTTVPVDVAARFYYGEPASGANVTWSVFRYRYFPPWWESGELFEGEDEPESQFGGEEVQQGQGRLDAAGRLRIPVTIERGEFDYNYRVEVRVADSSNRLSTGSAWFLATRTPFLVLTRPEAWLYRQGETVRVHVEARDFDNQPVAGVAFRLELAQWDSNTRKPGPVLTSRTGRTGADGAATVEFPAPPGGMYKVFTFAANPRGGEVREEMWLWVSGGWVAPAGGAAVRLTLDKRSYKTGEKAKILIATGVRRCDVWLTVEGAGLHWSRTMTIEGGSGVAELPIEPAYAPNVFVTAVFVLDGALHEGTKLLKVPPADKQLVVQVTASKAEYKPGEPATFRLIARDQTGQGVRAELSVGIVDEAIYAIERENQPDIVRVFYGRRWNRVHTLSSLDYFFYGESGKRRMELARLGRPPSRAQLKPPAPAGPKVRKNFPDTAFWTAHLETDQHGAAEIRMNFPDSLTTWRATARAVTAATEVGGAILRTAVRKDVVVSIAAPRFFTEGDEMTVPVLVRNYTSTAQQARVWLRAEGLDLAGGSDRTVEVPAQGEGRVDYAVRARSVEKARLTAQATLAGGGDALELTLPVLPYGLPRAAAALERLENTSSRTVAFSFPPGAGAQWRSVEVRFAPSLAGSILGALDYLLTYPYGCTEQTMSSFLPNVVVAEALTALGIEGGVNRVELGKKVKAGLERLYSYQHEDGGWGWWKDDPSDPFMTAYVRVGLHHAAHNGYSVEHWKARAADEWIGKRLAGAARLSPDTRAYLLYALALGGKPAREAVETAWKERHQMTSFGWALLGMAFECLQDARAGQAAAALEARAKRSGEEVYWESNRDPMFDFESDNSFEATAFAVRFLASANLRPDLMERAARWLMNRRDQGYYWSSTKRTAFVIYGIIPMLKRTAELKPDYTARVLLNGREVLQRRFGPGDALAPPPPALVLPIEQSRGEVRLEMEGRGRLYAAVNWRYRQVEAGGGRAAAPQSRMRVDRTYYRLKAVTSAGVIEYDLEPWNGPARPGDIVAVRLTVAGPARERYFVLEDPLPAGAEAVPDGASYHLRGRPWWWWFWAERREVRDTRVSWFVYSIPEKGYEAVYLMRFTHAGNFRASPARIEAMYAPGVLSWSDFARWEVLP